MAQLLTPVRADALLKFQSSSPLTIGSGHRWCRLAGSRRPRVDHRRHCCRRRRDVIRAAAAAEEAISEEMGADDYYAVLGLVI